MGAPGRRTHLDTWSLAELAGCHLVTENLPGRFAVHDLTRSCSQAAQDGFSSHAWQFPSALATFFDQQGHWQDWVTTSAPR